MLPAHLSTDVATGFRVLQAFFLLMACLAGTPGHSQNTAEKGPRNPPVITGPFPVRFVDSLSLLFYQAPLESARTRPPGTWHFSFEMQHSSHENGGRGGGFTTIHDEEVLSWELWGRYGICDRLELSFSLPFHHAGSGFLDDFITDFHETTGLGRTDERSGLFFDTAQFRNVEYAGFPENRMALGDVPLTLKYALWNDGPDPLGVAVRAGLGLPTGDPSDGFGSGRLDGGVGFLLEKSLSDVTFFASLDGAFHDSPKAFERAGVKLKPVTANCAIALEWRIVDWLAAVTQIHYGESLIQDAGGPILRRERLFCTIGANIRIRDDVSLRLGLLEDLVAGPVADVAFLLGLTAKF